MSVNISIRNVPDHIAEKLRRRAAKNHRSLQGELLAILEKSVAGEETMTPTEFLEAVKSSGLQTPDEAAGMIREERDARSSG
jgi:plasmid stability protein